MRVRGTVRCGGLHWCGRWIAANYKTPLDYEPVVMKYFCDGVHAEFKDEVRTLLVSNSSFNPANSNVSSVERDHEDRVRQLRALASSGLISTAQVRSTPWKFWSTYEVCALLSGSLALGAAAHFSLAANVIAAHTASTEHAALLSKANECSILGTAAFAELFTEDAPLGTTATYNANSDTFTVQSAESSGSNKFPVIHGVGAQFAVVVADLVHSQTNYGPHMFVVPLREGRALTRGVTCRSIGRTAAVDSLAAAVLRFDNVSLPRSALLSTTLDEKGQIQKRDDDTSPLLPLITNQRLAFAAVAVGRCKRLIHDIVNYTASREVVGPFGALDHPLLAVQHVQNRVVNALCELYMLIAAHHRVAAYFSDPLKSPEPEHYLQLALVSSKLIELMGTLGHLGGEVCGGQAVLSNSGFAEAVSMATLMREGASSTHVERLVAREIVVSDYGTASISGFVKNQLSAGFMKRFVSNPFFSPTSQEISRYLILFNDREYAVRSTLSQKYKVAVRNGAEDVFFLWNNEEHREVAHMSAAYSDRFLVESMYDEIARCNDQQNRRVLRDIAWQFSLRRMEDDLTWLLKERLFAPRHISHLYLQLDNITNNVAHQAVHLVDDFKITPGLKNSPLSGDWEAAWKMNTMQ
jgi:acyl-CoA oxidase